jgi:UDP-N-acetylglucosamine diphosphorylase/glucosamine-1-phosphate N-acetyltransferase
MRICIFEDGGVPLLEPLTLTRPAFDLLCGAETLRQRQRRALAAADIGAWLRPGLVELWRGLHPELPINDAAWWRERPAVLVNARWLPDGPVALDASLPHVGLVGKQVAFAVVPSEEVPPTGLEAFDAWLALWKDRLPTVPAGGAMLDYLWDVVDRNGEALIRDEAWFRAGHGARPAPPHVAVQGPAERLIVAEGAVIEPYVLVDTRQGPVLLDRGAVVHSFSRLEGPCYVGPDTWVVGAKLRGGSLGPCCRIGGEVEASIILGHSNKYHDGFLGHSYVGEWVNLAAGTQTSDLRNDYEMIRVAVAGKRVATGRNKAGSFIGDHTKTGLGALLNTGSAIGAFANVLPSGALLPAVIPSFCQVNHGQLQEVWDLRKLFGTAALVMRRRGQQLTDVHREFYYTLYEQTAEQRRKYLREGEFRRLRRSV